jgi:hypothetical protein
MTTVWILVALWIGTMAGFMLFALMAMARDSEHKDSEMFARRGAEARALARALRSPSAIR